MLVERHGYFYLMHTKMGHKNKAFWLESFPGLVSEGLLYRYADALTSVVTFAFLQDKYPYSITKGMWSLVLVYSPIAWVAVFLLWAKLL